VVWILILFCYLFFSLPYPPFYIYVVIIFLIFLIFLKVWSCAFSPRGDVFAAGRTDGAFSVYDAKTFSLLHRTPAHKQIVCFVSFRLVSSRFVSFRLVSSRLVSSRFVSCLVSFCLVLSHSFHSFHLVSSPSPLSSFLLIIKKKKILNRTKQHLRQCAC
jgi:hypothetical protein